MASKKSKFETKFTFKGNSKTDNKYANIYEDLSKKNESFFNKLENPESALENKDENPYEGAISPEERKAVNPRPTVGKTGRDVDESIKSTVREVSLDEAEKNSSDRKKAVKSQKIIAMQKSSPVVSKKKTPELDRETSLERLKREKLASKQDSVEETKNMNLDDILNDLRRKANSVDDDSEAVVSNKENKLDEFGYDSNNKILVEDTGRAFPDVESALNDLLGPDKTRQINLEELRSNIESESKDEVYDYTNSQGLVDDVKAQESAAGEIMRRRRAAQIRDKREEKKSRRAKREEQEVIRKVNQSRGISRAEVYKRGGEKNTQSFNFKKLVSILVVFVLLVVFVAAAVDKYIAYKNENKSTITTSKDTTSKEKKSSEGKSVAKSESNDVKKKKLENIKSKLNYDEAKRLEYIIENIDSYPADLIDLLLRNHETVDYVYSFKDKEKYNSKSLDKNITSSYYVDGEVPLFLQWDRRWGYRTYGNEMIGLSGCGPTSLAMVIRHFDSESTVNPYDIAKFSQESKFVSSSNTTDWKLFEDGVSKFGLQSVDVLPVEAKMKKSLDGGHILIASVNPGLFSTRGHIIVIKGYNSSGDFIINDPNSIINTNKSWSYDELKNYLRKIWGISRLGSDQTEEDSSSQDKSTDENSNDPSIIQDIE